MVGLGFGGCALAFVDGLGQCSQESGGWNGRRRRCRESEVDFFVGVGINQNADGMFRRWASRMAMSSWSAPMATMASGAPPMLRMLPKVAFQLRRSRSRAPVLSGHAHLGLFFNPFQIDKAFNALRIVLMLVSMPPSQLKSRWHRPVVSAAMTASESGACSRRRGIFLIAAGQISQEGAAGLVQAFFRFKVDDMDTGLVLEKVLFHAGVPFAGLVAQMNTGFNHLVNQIINHICM